MFFRVLDCIVKCWQSGGSCTGFEGALNVPLKILFDVGTVELSMVDYRRADGLFVEYLLVTEQTTSLFAECIISWYIGCHSQ